MIPEATPPMLAAALAAAARRELAALHGCVDWRLSAAPSITGGLARYDLAIGFAALAEVAAQLERDAADPGSADLGPLAAALASRVAVRPADPAESLDTLAALRIPPLAADAPDDLRRYFDALATRAAALAEVWVVETPGRRLPLAVAPGTGLLVLPLAMRAYQLDRPMPAPLTDAAGAPEVLVRLVESAKNGDPIAALIDWPLSGGPGIAAAVLAGADPSGPPAGLAELDAAGAHPEIALEVAAELEETLAAATAIVPAGPGALDALRIPELPADVPAETAAAFDRLRLRAARLAGAWVVVGPTTQQTYAVAPDSGLAVVRVD